MKSITFLLPNGVGTPAGGPKIVFEYSNRFVAQGYEVHIVMPASLRWSQCAVKEMIKAVIRYPYSIISKRHLPYKWFNLDRRVKLHYTWSLHYCFVPKTDVYIATAVETSEYLNAYKRVTDDNKFYFIQGFENWNVSTEMLYRSYKFKMNKIVISSHLLDVIKSQGEDAVLIANGFDFSYFRLFTPINEKNKLHFAMLYNTNPLKGMSDGVKSIELVREKYPQVRASFFGFSNRPSILPDWVDYYQTPNQETHNKIYNQAAIFIGPSHSEGFGLTLSEAMMCGCAVVCTDIGGYAEVCKDGFTALVSEVKNPLAMAQNIIRLIEDDQLRYTIAQNGNCYIKEYTWERAYSKFKAEIDK